MSAPPKDRPDRVPLLVLACGLAFTGAVTLLLGTLALDRRDQRFNADAAQAQATIIAKVETSLALLRATAGLLAAQTQPVTVPQFRTYVERIGLRERYPGILGIGFAQAITPGTEAAIETGMRAQGQEGFRVWPRSEDARLRTTIVFLEPLDARNRVAVGFDMATHPVRRAAMDAARDSGGIVSSGVVQLVQEIDAQKQPGFLLYAPVYSPGSPPATTEERRARLQGFAYSPIRAVDFLADAFRHESSPAVGMSVYIGRDTSPAQLLYARGEDAVATPPELRSEIDVAGVPWTLAFRARSGPGEVYLLPAIVGVVGIVMSLVGAVLVARQRRASLQARQSLDAERAARRDAERANRMKDDFLATLSHELRTPLHAIFGWTSLLRMPQIGEEQRRQGIDVIERNARAQARLIEDLLDMNRIATGKMTLEMRRADLRTIAEEALKSIRPAFAEKGVLLEARDAGQPLMVRVDASRVQQVVNNLLSNALKFTPPAGRVDVTLAEAGGHATFEVRDTGEGIEPEFLGRLFHRFTQADSSASRRHGGLGLGLAISKQLVELQGGEIHAESAGAGKGAAFTVKLPLASMEPTRETPDEPPSPHLLKGVRVLAVDDEADARELLAAILGAHGAHVRTAGSAEEALELLRAEMPDVLLSDISMPGTDGYALLRAVRALPEDRGRRVPAGAITAYARPADRDAALQAGFDAHMSKPLKGERLVQAVAELARRSVARREAVA